MALTDADLPKLIELLNSIDIRVQARRKTAAEWTASNEVLLDGEKGIETDTGWSKTGDGSTAWNSLLYTGWGRISTPPADGDVPIWDDANGRWAPGASSGSSDWQLVKKISGTPRASTTTMTDDPDLQIAIPGAGRYAIRGRVWILLGSQTAGINWQFNFTGSTSSIVSYRNNYTTQGTTSGSDNEFTLRTASLPSGSLSGNTHPHLTASFEMVLVATSAGTLSFQWAQVVSNANATQVYGGSYLEWADFS